MTRLQFNLLQITFWLLVGSTAWISARPSDSVKLIDRLEYICLPPGTFTMECVVEDPSCLEQDSILQKVTIKSGLWVSCIEVPCKAFQSFLEQCKCTLKSEGRH